MDETTKLATENAFEKLRSGDAPKSKNERSRRALAHSKEIERMRAQRLRLYVTISGETLRVGRVGYDTREH